jgi:hypothetical protein
MPTPSEAETLSTGFLRSLRSRGRCPPSGARLRGPAVRSSACHGSGPGRRRTLSGRAADEPQIGRCTAGRDRPHRPRTAPWPRGSGLPMARATMATSGRPACAWRSRGRGPEPGRNRAPSTPHTTRRRRRGHLRADAGSRVGRARRARRPCAPPGSGQRAGCHPCRRGTRGRQRRDAAAGLPRCGRSPRPAARATRRSRRCARTCPRNAGPSAIPQACDGLRNDPKSRPSLTH